MMKKVLTIIVSYNFEPWIHKCIPSLLHSSYPTDIIVIDNASKDNTVPILKEHYPTVILIESSQNLGFGKANNIGIEYALKNGYDYVYLVNQDAWLDNTCIQNLLAAELPTQGLYSPVHYDGKEQNLDKGFADYCKNISLDKTINQVDFVNAAFWFIPVATIRQVGLFSPIFYHYGEDKDFGNRLQYHKIPMYVIKDARAFHDRQDRKENLGINYKGEFVYHLTEFCNINYSWSKAFANAVLATFKKAAKQLLKGDLESTKSYLRITAQLWNKISEVKTTRQQNKIIKTPFNS